MQQSSVTFELTAEDIRDSISHFQRRGKYRWRFLLNALYPFLLACWALLVVLLAFATAERTAVLIFAGATGAFVLVSGLAVAQSLRMPAAEAGRWVKDPQLRPRLVGPQTMTVSADGVAWTHPLGDGRSTWPGVSRLERGKRSLHLYIGPSSAITIPLRTFATDAELEAFVSAVNEGLAASGRA